MSSAQGRGGIYFYEVGGLFIKKKKREENWLDGTAGPENVLWSLETL